MKRRLADTDDGSLRDAARRLEASVIETGNDVGGNPCRVAFGDFGQHPWHRKRLVIIAFDGNRPIRRIDGDNLSSRGRGSAAGPADLHRHGGGGVRVDDQNAHEAGSTPFPCRRPTRDAVVAPGAQE